jgi:hypothetical protein
MRWFASLAALVLLTGGIVLAPVAPRWLRAVMMVPVATRLGFVARRQGRGNGAQRALPADDGAFREDSLEDVSR